MLGKFHSRVAKKMDPDVRKLTLLLVLQLSLLTILECFSIENELVLLWHWQQLGCLAVELHRVKLWSGRQRRCLWAHDRGLHRPGFFDQNLLG